MITERKQEQAEGEGSQGRSPRVTNTHDKPMHLHNTGLSILYRLRPMCHTGDFVAITESHFYC